MLSPTPPPTEQEKENPYSLATFIDYAHRIYTNKNTQYQYILFRKRIEPYLEQDGSITQRTINKFLTSISDNTSYGNSFYAGGLKAVVRCYKDEFKKAGVELEVPKVRSARPYQQKKPKFLRYEEVGEIVRNIENRQLKIMVRLFFETGLRSSEMTSMKLSNIHLANRTMSGVGKRSVPFTVKFSPQARKLLEQWIPDAPNSELPFKLYGRDHQQPLSNQIKALDYYLKKECKRMGKEGIHVHRFRHALGYFLRADMHFDIVEVQRKLRHADIKSTAIYAPAPQEEVDAKIDREVFFVEDEGGQG